MWLCPYLTGILDYRNTTYLTKAIATKTFFETLRKTSGYSIGNRYNCMISTLINVLDQITIEVQFYDVKQHFDSSSRPGVNSTGSCWNNFLLKYKVQNPIC